MELRTCKKCDEVKALEEFPHYKLNGKRLYRYECRKCYNLRHTAWRRENPEVVAKAYKRKVAKMTPEQYEEFKKRTNASTRKYNRKYKEIVYAAYGGYICVCCNETEPAFLSIDHKNNDGYKHRKELPNTRTLYVWLYREHKRTGEWPNGFQILCMNCQHGKSRNNGICPHEEGATIIPKGSRTEWSEARCNSDGAVFELMI